MGRAGFVAVPGWTVIFDSLVLMFAHDWVCPPSALWGLRRDEIRSGFQNVKSAKIELCVTKLRLSGLGVGFFDRNI
jgi:hypothetical protein